jgi:hypothetical protein
VASCSPFVSRTPHNPQKRFIGGFSWRHRWHETCCSVMFVSSSSRRSTDLYTNADRNARRSRFEGLDHLDGAQATEGQLLGYNNV